MIWRVLTKLKSLRSFRSLETSLGKSKREKKLGWQTWGEKVLLQGGEIGLRVATEVAAIGSVRRGAPFFRDSFDRVVDGP